MRKFLVIALIALFAVGIYALPSFAVNPSGPGYAGDISGMATGRYASDPHRTFRLVRYNASTQTNANIVAGNIVVWDTLASPTCADGVSITLTTTSTDARVAGQMVTAIATRDAGGLTWSGNHTASEDVGQRNWGWLQTYGLSTTNATALQAITVGDAIATDTTAGQIGAYAPRDAVHGGQAGFAVETMAAAGTGKIFLKCE